MARWIVLPFLMLGLMTGIGRAGSFSYTTIDVPGAALTNAYGINKTGSGYTAPGLQQRPQLSGLERHLRDQEGQRGHSLQR